MVQHRHRAWRRPVMPEPRARGGIGTPFPLLA
jgi:hypothetical protein